MISYHKQIVSALNTVLPTYYEMALTKETKTPCISYMELTNYNTTEVYNHTLGYSYITYQVKVWGTDIAEIQDYAIKADKVLRQLGLKRISSGELYDSNSAMIQKILTYELIAKENYN